MLFFLKLVLMKMLRTDKNYIAFKRMYSAEKSLPKKSYSRQTAIYVLYSSSLARTRVLLFAEVSDF